MSYVENNLIKDEKVVHTTKHHWIIFFWPVVLFVGGIVLTISDVRAGVEESIWGVFILVGLIWLIKSVLMYVTDEFAVTNKRVIIKVGLIKRITLEMNLEKIESVGVNQSIPGRILNYGSIVIGGTGATKQPFKAIAAPMAFKKSVQDR